MGPAVCQGTEETFMASPRHWARTVASAAYELFPEMSEVTHGSRQVTLSVLTIPNTFTFNISGEKKIHLYVHNPI